MRLEAFVSYVVLVLMPEAFIFELKVSDAATSTVREHPDINHLQIMEKRLIRDHASINGHIMYEAGYRTQNDRLLEKIEDRGQVWKIANNVSTLIDFPRVKKGAIVTHIHIDVYQGSTIGSAFVVAGGIGQKHFTAYIASEITHYLRADADVYGY